MHIHRERVDRTQPWDTVYEPRTLSSPHDYGVPSLRVSPDGIRTSQGLQRPSPPTGNLTPLAALQGSGYLLDEVMFSSTAFPLCFRPEVTHRGWDVHSCDHFFF